MASRRRWETTLVLLFLFGFALISWTISGQQNFGLDFGPLWVGAQTAISNPSLLYDFSYVTERQSWLTYTPDQTFGARPFIYAPSALLIFAPFGQLPFQWAYGLWVALTGAFLLWAGWRVGTPWWLALFPPFAFVAAIGQVVLLTTGLIILGLHLRDRPWLSGLLFGIAGALKPQLLLFLPVALVAERRWTTLVSAGITLATMCLASLAWLGPSTWTAWVTALGEFHEVIFRDRAMLRHALSPYAQVVRFGVPGYWAYSLIPPMGLLVWLIFRRTTALAPRLIGLVGAALMSGTYAMDYELAVFAPAVALMVRDAEGRSIPLFASAAIFYGVAFPLGLPVLIGLLFLAWAWIRRVEAAERLPASV